LLSSENEELCQRVALISEGHLLLFGDLADIKKKRGANYVRIPALILTRCQVETNYPWPSGDTMNTISV